MVTDAKLCFLIFFSSTFTIDVELAIVRGNWDNVEIGRPDWPYVRCCTPFLALPRHTRKRFQAVIDGPEVHDSSTSFYSYIFVVGSMGTNYLSQVVWGLQSNAPVDRAGTDMLDPKNHGTLKYDSSWVQRQPELQVRF